MGKGLLGLTIALSLAATASAASAATITFVAPPGARAYADQTPEGPAGYAEAPTALRTSDPRPTIGIKADGGAQLVCYLDSLQAPQPCGNAPPGCGASICASFQPSAALGNDTGAFTRSHFLAVDLQDADGNSLASVWLNIDVDVTPPATHVDAEHGVLTLLDVTGNPLRPSFSYEITDGNSVGGNVDTAGCSWTAASAHPALRSCAASPNTNKFSPGRLPRRHRLYRVQVRGTDDFGRSTTASAVYDPIPCVLTVHRPRSLSSFLSSGMQTRLSCDTMRHVTVAAYAFMVNGNRSTSPRGAVANNPILGEYKVNSRTNAFSLGKRLKLARDARSALRQAHSLGLVLAAGDEDKILAGIADDGLSYQSFTLR